MNKIVKNRVTRILEKYNIDENKEKYYKKETSFQRIKSQKMKFDDIIMFTLSNAGKTLSLQLLDYFNMQGNIENIVTKQAISKQRQNIKYEIYEDMNKDYFNDIYSYRNNKLGKYNLIAVDGSTIEIPNTKYMKETFGEAKASDTSVSNARASITGFYDALNNIMIKLVVDKYHTGEKTMFLNYIDEVIEILGKDIIFIFDRGYISLELLIKLDELGVKYLFRVPSYCYKKEIQLAKSKDENIEINITKSRLKNFNKDEVSKYLSMEYKTERLVQIELKTDEIEYLITNLTKDEVEYDKMKNLYYTRWNIEKVFNLLKNRLHIENISARTKNGILQEIYATIFLGNIIEDFIYAINKDKGNIKENKEIRVNINLLAGTIKMYFIYLFSLNDIHKKTKEYYYKELLKFICNRLITIRKGNKNPRNKKVSRNKYKTNIRKNY